MRLSVNIAEQRIQGEREVPQDILIQGEREETSRHMNPGRKGGTI